MKKEIRSLKLSLFLMFSFCNAVTFSQSTINVAVNSTTFNPSNITINQGDMVVWTNNNTGNHNVNGSTSTFPSNPVSFGNALSTSWTYSFTFDTPGNYSYRCDTHFGIGMTGTVTVLATAENIELKNDYQSVLLYPNPAESVIKIQLSSHIEAVPFKIYAHTGSLVQSGFTFGEIDVNNIPSGIYFLELDLCDFIKREQFIIERTFK